jgi:benzoate 4-monooxygenase
MSRAVKIVQDCKRDPEKRSKNLLTKMIDARDDFGKPLGDAALSVEAAGFILAGSHTTSSSLAWIVWRLLNHHDVREQLVRELDQALTGLPRNQIPSFRQVEDLPWLKCVIKEGLRIDTAIPGSTPRYVPLEGATINGRYLPPQSIISAQAYSCHRDPVVFSDPESFLPSRWLNATPEMNRLYIPFGADGPRKCIGIHLAYMELRVILAGLFYRFDMTLAPDVTADSMDLDEYWLANPKAQRLNIFAKERA